jgi:hypothetical protein
LGFPVSAISHKRGSEIRPSSIPVKAHWRQFKRVHVCCVKRTPFVMDGHRHPGMLLAGVQGPDKTWIPAKNMPE